MIPPAVLPWASPDSEVMGLRPLGLRYFSVEIKIEAKTGLGKLGKTTKQRGFGGGFVFFRDGNGSAPFEKSGVRPNNKKGGKIPRCNLSQEKNKAFRIGSIYRAALGQSQGEPEFVAWDFMGCGNKYIRTTKTMVLKFTLRKTNMTMENPPFEDVFPIEHGDFPLPCQFTKGYTFVPTAEDSHGVLPPSSP